MRSTMKCMHNLNAHYEVHKQVHKAQNEVTLNRKFTKYASPFSILLWGKSGEGAFGRKLHMPPSSFLAIFNMCEVNNRVFWKNDNFCWRFCWCWAERHRSNLHCHGNRGQPCLSSRSQFEQQKLWWWLVNKVIGIFVQIFMNTINNKAKPQAH